MTQVSDYDKQRLLSNRAVKKVHEYGGSVGDGRISHTLVLTLMDGNEMAFTTYNVCRQGVDNLVSEAKAWLKR